MDRRLWDRGRLRCMAAPCRGGASGLHRVLVHTADAEAATCAKRIAEDWVVDPAGAVGRRRQTWLNVRRWDATDPWTGDGLPPLHLLCGGKGPAKGEAKGPAPPPAPAAGAAGTAAAYRDTPPPPPQGHHGHHPRFHRFTP